MGLSGRVFHAPFLAPLSAFDVVAVLERYSERSVRIFPRAEIVRDFDTILHDGSIELVVVNTPDSLHYDMCRGALEAGKHVVVEKPFVATTSEARELLDLARQRGLLLTVYQNRRFDGDFVFLRRLLSEGTLGEVVSFESCFEFWRDVRADAWRERGEGNSSALTNLGSHIIDQALLLFGRPRAVTALATRLRPGSRVLDSFLVQLNYPWVEVSLRGSYASRAPGFRFRVVGSKATWVKRGMDPQEAVLKRRDRNGRPAEGAGSASFVGPVSRPGEPQSSVLIPAGATTAGDIVEVPSGDYGEFYRRLAEALRTGGDPPVTGEEALLLTEVLEAAALSTRENRSVGI